MPLRFEVSDHVAVITIDSPPLNLVTPEDIAALPEIVDSFGANTDVRVAIITGAGDRSFTAGADRTRWNDPAQELTGPQLNLPGSLRNLRDARNYVEALLDSCVPIIAAVNGYCLGHGIGIIAASDIVLASRNARFGLPEINVGAANGHRMVRELFPRNHARHAFFTGEYIDADEAYRVGAVFSVAAPETLMDEAFGIARVIASKSPRAVRLFKHTVRWTENLDMQEGYRFEGQAYAQLRRDPSAAAELAEARDAFASKRPPDFDR
jgi:enoyl-CoA hydratase